MTAARTRRICRFLFAFYLTAAGTCGIAFAAHDYTPGRGLHLIDGHLVLGGYLTAGVSLLDEEAKEFRLDDLSAFVTYVATDELNFFGEFELEDAFSIDEDGFDVGRRITSLERLYAEWEPTQSLRLRAGQMLTPIGIWNAIHAAPLVWTSSRPVATEDFFDTGLTGLQIDSRTVLAGLDIVGTLFGQATDPIDATDALRRMERGGGGRLQVGDVGRWRVGLSGLRYRDDRDRRWRSVAGADLLIENHRWELSGEWVVNEPDNGRSTWAMYLQGVCHLGGGIHPVLRVEHVRREGFSRNPLVLGLAYKSAPNTVWKIEGIVGRKDLGVGGNGILTSVAVLF